MSLHSTRLPNLARLVHGTTCIHTLPPLPDYGCCCTHRIDCISRATERFRPGAIAGETYLLPYLPNCTSRRAIAVKNSDVFLLRPPAGRSCSGSCASHCSCTIASSKQTTTTTTTTTDLHPSSRTPHHNPLPLSAKPTTPVPPRAPSSLSLCDQTPASTLAARRHYDHLGHASHDTFPAKGHNSFHAKALGTASAEIHCLAYLARLFRPP